MDRFARIQEILSDKVDDFLFYIKQPLNWKIIARIMLALFICIACVPLYFTFYNIGKHERTQVDVVNKWIAQLPRDHWLCTELLPNGVPLYSNLLELSKVLHRTGLSAFERGIAVSLYQSFTVDLMIRTEQNIILKKDDKSYVLKDAYDKTYPPYHTFFSTKIKLKASDSLKLNFYRNDQLISFDVTKPEHKDSKIKPYVISCVDDPAIATITNGIIEGVNKGKTTLMLSIDNHILEYQVVVE